MESIGQWCCGCKSQYCEEKIRHYMTNEDDYVQIRAKLTSNNSHINNGEQNIMNKQNENNSLDTCTAPRQLWGFEEHPPKG